MLKFFKNKKKNKIIETIENQYIDFQLDYKVNAPEGFIKGRCLKDGYTRGIGLRFGDIKEPLLRDKLFNEAYDAAKGRTIVGLERLMNLYLIIRFYLNKVPSGHIVEFGSYKGGSAIFMAYIAKQLYPDMKVYALDTFAGMPQTDSKKDIHSNGDFKDTCYDDLVEYKNSLNLDNLEIVKGLFQDTTEYILKEAKNIALTHIDCDIYSAVQYSYDTIKKYLVNEGYIIFDDATAATCIGATEAVEDLLIRRDGLNSEQIYPHFVFRNLKNKD